MGVVISDVDALMTHPVGNGRGREAHVNQKRYRAVSDVVDSDALDPGLFRAPLHLPVEIALGDGEHPVMRPDAVEHFEIILDFIRQESPNLKASMAKLLRTIRKLVCFLRSEGITDLDADRFLTTAGRYRRKALPCFNDGELRAIFAQIDRSTDKGRRDYAVFLTALRTGLRACDLSRLKLSDIDWTGKVIKVVQKKNLAALHLPLPADVGNAIADYILHSRHRSDSPYVFLRLRDTPTCAPLAPTSFNYSLREYMKAAGMERTGWDGRSFHALRRTAGTRMVVSGVPVSTVAQILGHTDMESTKRYISLDTERLRECCLDLGMMHTRKEGLS